MVRGRDGALTRRLPAAFTAVALAVATAVAGAPMERVHAADPVDPWTTVAIVVDPARGEVVQHLRTGTASASGAQLLGEVVLPGAQRVVSSADGRTLQVLTAPVGARAAEVRSVSVEPTGALVLESASVAVGGDALDLALSPDGRHVYTADGAAGTVSAVDRLRGEVHPITVGGQPSSLVIAPDGLRAVVLDAEGRILLVDLVTGAVGAERSTAARPVGIALDDRRARVIVASQGASDATGVLEVFALDAGLTPLGSVDIGDAETPARPLGIAVGRETGQLVVPLAGEDAIARFAQTDAGLMALEPRALPNAASTVSATVPRGDQVEVALLGSNQVGRVDPGSSGLDHTYAIDGEVRALIALPGQPVALSAPANGPSLRGSTATLSVVADRPQDVAEYRWQIGASALESTTVPQLQRTFTLEGGYAVEVEAITALGASAVARFDGRTALAGGSQDARATFTHRVDVVEKLGEQVFRSPINFLEPNNAHFWAVPTGTVQLVITAAGTAGGAGEESGGGFGDVCDAFGESCTNPGGPGGPRPVLRVEVPVGDDELVAAGDVLGIPVAGPFANGHNQLLGGLGGDGGGTDGGRGGNGGGGSGVYLQSPEEGYPWIIVAPGGGGGGGGGLSSFAGFGGAGVANPSAAAFGEGSAETRGVPRAQCVTGVNAFAINGGGPAGQEAQRGDPGRSAGSFQTSTGGQGGGGGGCFGGAAGAEGPDSFSGGAGGAGGVGYSLYPSSTTDLGTLGTTNSFVRIEWFGDNPTSSPPVTQATPTLRAVVGIAADFAVPFAGIGSAPIEPDGLPDGLAWVCESESAVPSCAIRGTAEPGTAGQYPIEIVAGGGTRTLTLVIEEAPAVGQAVPSELVWPIGEPLELVIASTGDPMRTLALRGAVPPWLNLASLPAAGAATLQGSPPAGSAGSYALQLVVAQDARTLTGSLSPAWAVHDLVLRVVGDDTPTEPPVDVEPPPPVDPSDPEPPPGDGGPDTPGEPVAPGAPPGTDGPAEPTGPDSGDGETGPPTEGTGGVSDGSGRDDDVDASDASAGETPSTPADRFPFGLASGAVWPIGIGLLLLLLVGAGLVVRAALRRRA